VQVLVLATSDEAAAFVKAAVEAAAKADGLKSLVVEAHGPRAQQMSQSDLARVRVVLVCLMPESCASSISAVEAEVDAHVRAGHAHLIPVLLG
jgi:hypothetical protein